MVRKIVKDTFFLSQVSEEATRADEMVIVDLMDTLAANEETCVGLAANMIGVRKRIIAVDMDGNNTAMINPIITKMSGQYETKESCLSLSGVRETIRYENIVVEYLDKNFRQRKGKYSGWLAQIIQHEVDHCNGIVI